MTSSRHGMSWSKHYSIIKFKNPNFKVFIAFMMGILIGRLGIPSSFWPSSSLTTTTTTTKQSSPNPNNIQSSIKHIQDVPIRNTVHIDQDGQPITKQQFLDPFLVPDVAGFSVATIQPGQTVSRHSHKTMHEFFYVIGGGGNFIFDDEIEVVSSGSFIHIVPPTEHEIVVPSENRESLKSFISWYSSRIITRF